MLEVRDLAVDYLSEGEGPVRAVEGASFEIAAGEAIGLFGESGSGKTTLALAILGLLASSSSVVQGSARFKGRELLGLAKDELQKIRGAEISLVFQEPGTALNPVMRVGDQIAEVVRAHCRWTRSGCRDQAKLLLAEVGLSDALRFYSAYPHELSGGQRQRVAMAQALACRPALVIADEPTAALDSTVQAEILSLLKELRQKLRMALLVISHNPAVLSALTDRILVMQAGKIVEQGSIARVFGNPRHPYTQRSLRLFRASRGREAMQRFTAQELEEARAG